MVIKITNGKQNTEVHDEISLWVDVKYEKNTYNAFNQLTSTRRNAHYTVYTYLPNGLRYSKNVNGAVTKYTYYGDQIIGELNCKDNKFCGYIRGINSELLKNTDTTWYLKNGHGDITQLTNENGTVQRNINYDAFGNEENPLGTDTNPWKYCGEYFDDETDNYYLRARYYDPSTGRFTQEDPIRDGLNWYSYCAGNPVNHIDPSGLDDVIIYTMGEKRGDKSDWVKQATWMQKELLKDGRKIHIIGVNNAASFEITWNSYKKCTTNVI